MRSTVGDMNARTLLTVMAHPDDAELWAGGVAAQHAAAGTETTIAVPRSGPARDRDAAAGAAILGATVQPLAEPAVPVLRDLLQRMQPEVVITHHPDDIHPDHQHLARLLLAALPEVVISSGRPRRVYGCDGYHNLDRTGRPLHLPVIVDVTDVWRIKLRALAAHTSQPIADHFEPMADTLGRLHGGRIGARYAEAFVPLPVLGRLSATTDL